MTILAVETSTPEGSLVIGSLQADGLKVLAEEKWNKRSSHSDVVTTSLQRALEKAGVDLTQMTHFAVDVGPGSFTGVRVGLNLVKSLAYSLSKPVLSINSLELLAFQNLKDGQSALVAIKAIQNLYYFSGVSYLNGSLVTTLAPTSGTIDEIKKHLSDYTKVLIEGEPGTPPLTPHAKDLALMAAKGGSHCVFHSWQTVKPLYVRGSEAEEKLKKVSK